MKYKLFIFIVLLAGACAQSTEPTEPPTPPLNPNGDSELALLMRDMFDDGMAMKQAILAGEKPEVSVEFMKIHTAEATEPEKAASGVYKSFAQAYQLSVEQLQAASVETAEAHYTSMIDNCMSCHKALCPGPTMRIQKLEIASNQ